MTTTSITVEDVPLNHFHRKLTIRSGGGSLVDGYVLGVLGIALMHASTELGFTSFWEGMIAAASLAGIFFGGFLGGWLTNQFGRKKVFFIGPIIFITASLGQYWVDSALSLFLLRLLIGLGVGIEYPVATALLVEFLPKQNRGPRLAALAMLWFAGAALSYVVGELILRSGIEDAWRVVLASGAVFGAWLLLVRIGTPESPRWLIGQGRNSEAEQIVKQVYGAEFSLRNLPEPEEVGKLSIWNLLHSGYGKRMFFVVVFWTCSVIPIFAVYAFAPKVLAALGLKGDIGSIGSVIITLFFVIGCMIATKLINRLGRRPMLIYSFLLSGISLLGLGVFPSSGTAIVVCFALYALFIGGAQVLTLVYPNEIFPTEIRSFAVGIGTSFSRVGAAVGTYLVPISLDSIGISQTMYVAALITLVGLVFSWMMAPETRSMSLQQAAALR